MQENIQPVKGFSKLSKDAKLEWLSDKYLQDGDDTIELIKSYWHKDAKTQQLHDEFIENTITNFYLPFGIAPNFMINDTLYCLPMAIEESSVVAAAAKAARYWLTRGGFKAEVISTKKVGHVHFSWNGDTEKLQKFFNEIKSQLLASTDDITVNMRKRGGGIVDIELIDKTLEEPNYYQIQGTFETCDSMGANFINSILESIAKTFKAELANAKSFTTKEKEVSIIMCILSNYTPECIVRSEVSCKVEDLIDGDEMSHQEFTDKFKQAIRIAQKEPYRATTHNKGIMNGIDAVVIATGNDFRAVEACAHTYASRDGQYRSLTDVEVKNGMFKFFIEIPMALGTVGGLTSLHPMVKLAHKMLGNPNAEELMKIIASAGLAQNFGAVRSLVTTGIQKGHMKMHLLNIMNQLGANDAEKEKAKHYFKDKVVSVQSATNYFYQLRGIKNPNLVTKK